MRFTQSSSLQCLAAAATEATMSSTRFPTRGRNPWRRGLSDRSGSGSGGGRGDEAFISGDSHFRTVRDTNFGFRQGQRGDCGIPGGFPRQPFRPRPSFQPRQRPEDFRSWENALSQPPPNCERFVVLSYNILADYLARDHRPKLYFHIPPYILDWDWRKRRIMIELGLWSPDIMCLQEVDRFQDFEEELKLQGYHGIWKMRTGPPVDGCAIFWRTTRFKLLHEEHIEFDKLGLRNNVAQICVLESRSPGPTESDSAASPRSSHHSRGANQVVVCNIHVLYNPNRGDIKIGQVRVLLDRAHAVSRTWNDAPVIVCGDFNCTPKSPLYNFILEQKLNLSGLAKNQVSGQFSASIYPSQPNSPNFNNGLSRDQSPYNSVQPSTSVVDKASVLKQYNYSTETHNQLMLQNDFEGASEGRLENSLDGSSDERGSSQCGLNVVEETLRSCDEQVGISLNSPNLRISNPAVATLQEEFVCGGDMEEERLHFSKTVLSFEENLSSESRSAEEKADYAISHQSTEKMFYLASSRTDQCIQDAESSGGDLGTTSGSEVMPIYKTQNVSSFDVNYKNGRPGSDKCSQSSKDCASSSGIQRDPCHYFGSGIFHVSSQSRESCESSDTETICENRNDIVINSSSSEQALYSSYMNVNQPQSFSSSKGHIVGKLVEVNFEKPDATISDDSQLEHLSSEILVDSSLSMDPKVTEVEKKPYDPYLWTPIEVATASGNAECSIVEHHLKLKSTYTEVADYAGTKDLSKEPQVTSYNRQFMGTVDYIWCSEGLQTVGVLDTIPKHVLQRTPGFPTRKWGSDHLAIACRLAFTKNVQTEDTSNHE